MEKRTKKMLLAILMIISVLAADFFVLGSGIMTYASELSSETNNTNVEFSVFFKDGENRLDATTQSIKAEDVRLYAELKVKNEGYLKEGTVIELENNNFNLKNEILESNTHIKNIEGNKVNLKQIDAGETVEIELGIEPAISDKMTTDYLSQVTTVKMIGTYVYSKAEDGESIRTDKLVSVNYQPDDTTGTELTADIITNTVLSVNGTNKRIVQLLIKSRITNNEYPVKQTTMSVEIPEINGETPEVSAMAISELATNGTTEIDSVTTEDGKVRITLKNEPDENNQISWNKNAYDEVVITYIYPETVEASDICYMDSTLGISVYNSDKIYMAAESKNLAIGQTIPESNSVIMGRTEITTEELYKGKLYTNLELNYNTETNVIITNPDVVDEIVVHEGPDVFGTDESELAANTKYVATEINLEKMLDIVGQDGNIEIKNGETTTLINKETAVDANGNVVINYENGASELYITTSKPVVAGILELKHTKAIAENNYTRTQLQEVKTIITKGSVEGSITVDKEKQNVISKTTEPGTLELKETTSKAELTIENNKTELSTTQENEVTLGITLVTNGEQYDLYKNPKISLKFPDAVENVELLSTPTKQNADEFTVTVGEYNATKKTLQIAMQGEQTAYPSSSLTQSYIQLNLKVILSSLATTATDKIMMAYTNENAVQYEGGRTDAGLLEQTVHISAPSQLIKMFNISTNENTSTTETIQQQITKENEGQTISLETILVNNLDSDMNNVRILGKLPTTGNIIEGEDENTLETTLKSITAENAAIYYTENTNATTDIEDSANGWTTESENAKMYLIVIETLPKGNNYTTVTKVQLPNTIEKNLVSYAQYEVIYDTAEGTNITESSRKIGLVTRVVSNIETTLTAQVGNDILKNGDIVKAGEVIKYIATITNNTNQTLKNIGLKVSVPEGTVLVQPIEDYEYSLDTYYEEITDEEKIAEITSFTISELIPGYDMQIQYEVRVKTNITTGTKISNQAIGTYNNKEIASEVIENILQESDIRATIKRIDDEDKIYVAGLDGVRMEVYIENLSSETIKDLKLKFVTDTFSINKIEIGNILLEGEGISEEISINEIPANSGVNVWLMGKINEDIEKIEISAIVTDSNGEEYRSNVLTQELPNIDARITLSSEPLNETIVTKGQTIEYYSTVTNTGENEIDATAKIDISDYLDVQEVYVNNQIFLQETDETDNKTYVKSITNSITYSPTLGIGESADIKIIANVKEDVSGNDIDIVSKATVSVLQVKKDSKTVIHTINNGLIYKNTIGGVVWLDENGNGQIDGNESALQGVSIRIYNKSTQDYLRNENGNVITAETGNNGQYSVAEIEDGTYSVVFKYDKTKYEPTTHYAEGVDSSKNSKGFINNISIKGTEIEVTSTELIELQGDILNLNLGLKIKETAENPGEPENPETPVQPEIPEEPADKNRVTGLAWLDANRNGQKEFDENVLSGIKVKAYDASTEKYLEETITNSKGKYEFNNLEKGSYIFIFEYDTEKYEPTTYSVPGVDTTVNSKVVLKKINVDGQEITVAVTDTINVQEDVSNINLGLKEKLTFDLELNKYISKIVVQTSEKTKTYEYEGKTLGKVEIHRKQVQGALVVLEYTITVKNTGEIAGYAKNVVDYLPSGLNFSSELNKDWYISRNYLYTKCLENVELAPGEEKEIKLILTKTMTNENVGLINNRAEIYQDYNKYGEHDIDSTPNNQAQNEDDFGTTDVIIQVATGGSVVIYIMLAIINMVLIYVAIRIMIKNEIIEITTKEERR